MSCAQAYKQDVSIRNVKTVIQDSESVLRQYLNPIVECECMLVDGPLCRTNTISTAKLSLETEAAVYDPMVRRQPKGDTQISVRCETELLAWRTLPTR